MDLSFIWESFILIISGILLLRLAGRKSISQMTIAPTVMMISLGTIIVQPIVERSIIKAIGGAFVFVLSLVIIERLEQRFNIVEKLITGKVKTVIENGKLNVQSLKEMRMTVDQLEMRLREQGITKFEDVKTATIEPNGKLGYELQDDAKPLTVGEFKKIMNSMLGNLYVMNQSVSTQQQSAHNGANQTVNIFEEIDSSQKRSPKHLQ